MRYVVTYLLDETDRSTRLRQHALLLLGVGFSVAGITLIISGTVKGLPRTLTTGIVLLVIGIALHFLAARTVQLFETDYKGHRIRFTNNPLTAERLYIDDALVARGGFGFVMRLEAMIPSGQNEGDRIVATSEARFTSFRCRIEAQTSAE